MANKKRESEITVVACYPGEKAEIAIIDNTLDSMKQLVDGYIQALYPFPDAAIVCNEEGKIRCLEPCRALYSEDGKIYDVIAGTFFICGVGEDFRHFFCHGDNIRRLLRCGLYAILTLREAKGAE